MKNLTDFCKMVESNKELSLNPQESYWLPFSPSSRTASQLSLAYFVTILIFVCVCCVVGLYQLFNVQKKEMSLSDFKELANSERYKQNWF